MKDYITLPRAVVEQVQEAHKCFEAAQFEGWEAAIQSGDIDRIRDLWQRRMSHGVAALDAALAEPDATREPATVEQVAEAWWHNIHANFFGGWHEAERFHGIITKEDKT